MKIEYSQNSSTGVKKYMIKNYQDYYCYQIQGGNDVRIIVDKQDSHQELDWNIRNWRRTLLAISVEIGPLFLKLRSSYGGDFGKFGNFIVYDRN